MSVRGPRQRWELDLRAGAAPLLLRRDGDVEPAGELHAAVPRVDHARDPVERVALDFEQRK